MNKESKDKQKRIEEEEVESQEWLDSLDYVIDAGGVERAAKLIKKLQIHAQKRGVRLRFTANTPYINTIPVEKQPPYPGDLQIEWNIRSLIRWNAMAMVVRANRLSRSSRSLRRSGNRPSLQSEGEP